MGVSEGPADEVKAWDSGGTCESSGIWEQLTVGDHGTVLGTVVTGACVRDTGDECRCSRRPHCSCHLSWLQDGGSRKPSWLSAMNSKGPWVPVKECRGLRSPWHEASVHLRGAREVSVLTPLSCIVCV